MMKEEIDRLYLLVGRIATDFSSVESLWYLIFTCLLHQTPRSATDAIFNQIMGGNQQRKLIVAVAKATLPTDSPILKLITDLVAQTSKAAERRNAAVHSIIHIADYAIPPHVAAMGISKRSSLADKDIPAELADLYRTIATLELDLADLRLLAIESAGATHDLTREKQNLMSARSDLKMTLEADKILKAIEGR